MSSRSAENIEPQLDLSDVDHRVGQLVGGGQLMEPCSTTDIRRWVMAMDYPNPIHWDEEFARNSKFGGIVAPQSFAAAMDYGHGVQPACVGRIPGSHLIFGGEEWWFYGHRMRPGDRLFQERRFHDYKVVRDQVRRPHHVLARRHHPHQPEWHIGGARTLDEHPLSGGRGRAARHVPRPKCRRCAVGRRRS